MLRTVSPPSGSSERATPTAGGTREDGGICVVCAALVRRWACVALREVQVEFLSDQRAFDLGDPTRIQFYHRMSLNRPHLTLMQDPRSKPGPKPSPVVFGRPESPCGEAMDIDTSNSRSGRWK